MLSTLPPGRTALAVLFASVLGSMPLGVAAAAEPGPSNAAAAATTVRLVVRYGDGVETHFVALPWKKGMTVLDALAAAQKHRHGITFVQRGKGTSALVTQIGDVKNEGTGKNWIFSVNDKTADVGAGGYELKAGDAILWKFSEYDYNSKQ